MTRLDALYFAVSQGAAFTALGIALLLDWSRGAAGWAVIGAVTASLVTLDLVTDRTPRRDRRARGATSAR